MVRRRLLSLLFLAPLLAACGYGPSAAPRTPAKSHAAGPSFELALVRGGSLYLVTRAGGNARLLTRGLHATHPTFSPDGKYVAVLAQGARGSEIAIVRTDGKGTPQIFRPAWRIAQGEFAWNPRRDELAVWGNALETLGPGVQPREIAHAAGRVMSFAWTPDGRGYAYVVTPPSMGDELYVAPGGAASRPLVSAGPANGLEIARFSPSGTDLLYWIDPLHSASLAADGLGLLSVPAAGGAPPKMLAVTLPYPSWVQPHGQSVLIVAGAGREATTNKRIATCDAKTGSCAPLQAGQGQVALDPAGLVASASIAYITAKDLGASPSSRAVSAWDASRTLYVLHGGKGVNLPRAVAKGDVFDPSWQAGGSELVYLQRGVVWLLGFGKAPLRLAPLDATAQRGNGGTSDVTSYYGYTTYRSRFAFYAPAPSARGAN